LLRQLYDFTLVGNAPAALELTRAGLDMGSADPGARPHRHADLARHAYHTAGRMADAIAVFQRTLADCERVLGPNHPMTHTLRENLEAASNA
jgi:hypothetical protein